MNWRSFLINILGNPQPGREEAPQALPDARAPWELSIEDLKEKYSERWTLFGSLQHGWWASSRETDVPHGCKTYISAHTLPGLEAQLMIQEQLRGGGLA